MYGLFLLFGVEGMPPAPFMPKNTREISRLKGYGKEFGTKAAGTVARYFRNQEDSRRKETVRDVLSMVFLKLYTDKSLKNTLEGKDLSFAEHYILRAVHNQALDVVRSEKKRKTEDVEDMLVEPASWDTIGDILPQAEQSEIIRDIKRVVGDERAEDVALYFQLMLDGYSDVEITKGRLLPYLREKEFQDDSRADGMLDKYKRKIREVLLKHDVQPPV
jgi:DNA-directed RNA polymerase specialized sigma24 family protein